MSENTSSRYVKEVTPGMTPTDDAGWRDFPYDSMTNNAAPVIAEPTLIIGDRMERSAPIVGKTVDVNVATRLIAGQFDDWMASALHGIWATDVLKFNSAAPLDHYTLEVEYGDLSTEPYLHYIGTAWNSMTLTAVVDDTVQMAFSGMAMTSAENSASLVGLGSTTPVASVTPMDFALGMEALEIGGSAPSGLITRGVEFTFEQGLRAQTGGGPPLGTKKIVEGMGAVTGTITAYWGDASQAIYKDLQAGNPFDLLVTIGNGSQSYTIDVPNCRLLDGQPNVPGRGSDITPAFAFRALYDATSTTVATITRVT